ncbi:hypothetical protein [Qipengyuania sp. JC766]
MPMWLFDFIDEIFMPNPEKDDGARRLKRLVLIVVLAIVVVWLFD